MDVSKQDKHKLEQTKQTFKIQDLTKEQAEFILGRKLTDKGWQDYETSERRKRKKTNIEVYSAKRLFKQSKKKPKKPDFNYSDIAKHAAIKAQHLQAKKQQQGTDEVYRIAKLFKSCLLYTSPSPRD